MRLHTLVPSGNGRRKRVGRGESSGLGRTSGRGNKGARSRSGYRVSPVTSGIPWYRRLPIRGFSNYNFRREYAEITLRRLSSLVGKGIHEIDLQVLLANRLLRPGTKIFKVIGKEVLEKPILVRADAFSAGAAAAICSSGGQAVVLHSSGSDGSRSVERK